MQMRDRTGTGTARQKEPNPNQLCAAPWGMTATADNMHCTGTVTNIKYTEVFTSKQPYLSSRGRESSTYIARDESPHQQQASHSSQILWSFDCYWGQSSAKSRRVGQRRRQRRQRAKEKHTITLQCWGLGTHQCCELV